MEIRSLEHVDFDTLYKAFMNKNNLKASGKQFEMTLLL